MSSFGGLLLLMDEGQLCHASEKRTPRASPATHSPSTRGNAAAAAVLHCKLAAGARRKRRMFRKLAFSRKEKKKITSSQAGPTELKLERCCWASLDRARPAVATDPTSYTNKLVLLLRKNRNKSAPQLRCIGGQCRLNPFNANRAIYVDQQQGGYRDC